MPVNEFLNAPPPSSDSSSDKKDKNDINDPNSVSNRQAPMIQISDDLKVISIPLSTDIANPHIHKKYLLSKSIPSNATRLKVEGKDTIKLIHDRQETENNENDKNMILEGTISVDTYSIRWSDGSSWNKQGVIAVDNDHDDQQNNTPSSIQENSNNITDNQQINALRSQLEISKEKEKMAKTQSQATMVWILCVSMCSISEKRVFQRFL